MKKIAAKKKPVKPKENVSTKYFVPIYTGLIHGYAETAKLSAFQLGLYVVIHAQADFSTGIWMGSAYKLLATVPRDNSLQACQRALRHMVDIGLLKHFRGDGVRGNTAYLINKFKIRSGERLGQVLNATESTSLKHIVYDGDAVSDTVSDMVGDAVREPIATQGDAFLRSKEVEEVEVKESKKKQKEKSGAAKPAAADVSARLYIEKIKRLSNLLTDSLTEKHLESWPEPPHLSFQFQKDYQEMADLDGIDFRDFQNLYRGAMRCAEWTVTPQELVGPGPITEALIEQWAAEAASNPDVLEIIRDDGSSALTLVFANGIEYYRLGDNDPEWHPFYDEAPEEPVQAHAMPDAPSDAPTVSA